MTTKLVCRLLDKDGHLLAWCMHHALALGDGMLRAASPVIAIGEAPGILHEVSIHWTDVNAEIRVPAPPVHVAIAQPLTIFQTRAPMLEAGKPPAQRLPPVTVRNRVDVAVPYGHEQLGTEHVQLAL